MQDPRVGVLVYYAVLAYPNTIELARRRNFAFAMAALRIKTFSAEIGSRKDIPPRYTGFKNEKIRSAKNLAWKRLARRVSAGVIGSLVCLSKTQPYEGATLKAPATLNEAIRQYLSNQHDRHIEWDDSAVPNAKHRVWAESLPVLHLAMTNPITVRIANDLINQRLKHKSKDVERDLLDSIEQPNWLPEALEDAEHLRSALGDILGTDPDDPLGRGFRAKKAIHLFPTDNPARAYQFLK